jgi:hypothetical protein
MVVIRSSVEARAGMDLEEQAERVEQNQVRRAGWEEREGQVGGI